MARSKQALGWRIGWLTVLTAVIGFGGLELAAPRPVAQAVAPLQLPNGFVDELVVGGLHAPRAFEFAPDGRLFILEQGGANSGDINLASVRVFKNGALLPARALTLNICGDGERGLLGIAFDPNFASNAYLYLYYTRQKLPNESGEACGYNKYTQNLPGARNRVSRFTMTGGDPLNDTIDAASERVLIDNLATDTGIHNAGDLHFGADGYLYVSVGDSNLAPSPAQYKTNLNGKILRLKPTNADPRGYITTGNPFDTAPSAQYCSGGNINTVPLDGSGTKPCREVYAYGFRNPFRFTIKPGTSTLYVGDVGGGAWEEVDEVATGGGNYGWPVCEGLCGPTAPPGLTNPVYTYPHPATAPTDSAIIGGAFYTGTVGGPSYPAQYVNSYYFADFARGFIRQLTYNSGNDTWGAGAPDFATGGNSIVGLKTGATGDLYYVAYILDLAHDPNDPNFQRLSEIRRIRYQPGLNQTPYAQVSVSPSGSADLNTVYTFSAAGSGDPDANLPLTYNWDFGDAITATTAAVTTTHQYSVGGATVVTLTVSDSGVPVATSAPVTVTVYPGNAPPTASIVLTNTTAATRTEYYAGDVWEFGAVNVADDTPPVSLSWEVVFHHRTHTHPFLPSASQTITGTFTIPVVWEPDPVVWFRVHLHLMDAQGQTNSFYADVMPHLSVFNLDTNPEGGEVQSADKLYAAPAQDTRVTGLSISLMAPASQAIGVGQCSFTQWSDSGPQTHTIIVPASVATYTAQYGCLYQSLLPALLRNH